MAETQRGLTEEVKRRIVVELARFKTPPEVRTILLQEYEVELRTQDIIRYDATKDYCVVGPALRDLFERSRKEYVAGSADLYIAHQSYRLRRLQQLSMKAEEQGNIRLAAELLEQAAKDFGGAFTNVRQIEGNLAHVHMTPDVARAKLEGFLKRQPPLIEAKPNEGEQP